MAPGDGSIKGGSEVKSGKNVNGERYTTVKEVAERYGLSSITFVMPRGFARE